MLHADTIWELFQHDLVTDAWTALDELYALVEGEAPLDEEDLAPAAPGHSDVRWRRNVRNVLQQRRASGEVEYDGTAHYRLPSFTRSAGLQNLTADSVRAAMDEFDRVGRAVFLTAHGFGRARDYFLDHDGREYDSKAIAGVAHEYARPDLGPLRAEDFSGGEATVRHRLEELGFHVRGPGDSREDKRFGSVPGIAPGAKFDDRRAVYDAGVHRALIAGIVGRADEGAESIVLSGGYVDDEDYGDEIIYTGHGGRDSDTKRQVADQEMTRQNLALVRSEDGGIPVRVVRAVEGEHRYDGLFRVVAHWHEQGRDGFRVYRYRLLGEEGAEPALPDPATGVVPEGEAEPGRREGRTQRVVRQTAVGQWVKEVHDYRCQVCGERVELPTGPYAEAAHIRPLGRPHNGPDVPENVLCLCPNDHVRFDKGAIAVTEDRSLVGAPGVLRISPVHSVDPAHLAYHRTHVFEGLVS